MIVILAAVLLTVGLVYYFKISKKQIDQKQQVNIPKQPYKMRGEITQVNKHSIVVKGVVGVSGTVGGEVERTIEFTLNSETVYKQQANIVTRTVIAGGPDSFTSSVQDRPGAVSDVNTETKIIYILSNDDLFSVSTATTKEIYYSTNVFTTL